MVTLGTLQGRSISKTIMDCHFEDYLILVIFSVQT
jgi:hypothetical protein